MTRAAPEGVRDVRTPRAPVICVCGLHGGAGTTTAAALLAAAAATQSHAGDVALLDADPCAGGLALHLGAASPTGLHALARAPHGAHPWVDFRGARLLAPAPGLQAPAGADELADALDELAVVHRLLVVDAGPVGASHAQVVLPRADLVLWSIDATAHLPTAARALASPLTRAARHAPWALVAHATGRNGILPPAAALAATAPRLRGLVLTPRLHGAADAARMAAGRDLLQLLL